MSMMGEYRRLSPGQLQGLQDALQGNPEAVGDFLHPEERSYDKPDPQLKIERAWHGIEFLLYGEEGSSSVLNVVMGGTAIGDEGGYGPARYLLPEQVKEASQALGGLSKNELRKRFDPAAFEAAHIYPRGWTVGEPDAAFEWLWGKFVAVRDFFQEVARCNDVMLMYLS